MPSVLFICTANICRSPIAMALFKAKIANLEDASSWIVESAGTWAVENLPVARKSQQVMLERGVDLSGHRSRCVTKEMLQKFNLILTMEQGHKEALVIEFPEIKNRVYVVSEMVGPAIDIPDPFGTTLIDFMDMARELDRILTCGFEKIVRLAQG